MHRIFDSTKEFRIRRGVSAYALDRLSVFKIDKISGSRSVCLHVTICLYLHQRLAYSESCAFLVIILANYLTRYLGLCHSPPRMKLSSVKPAENLRQKKKPACKDGLFPSFKRNICESLEMQYIIHLDHKGMPLMSFM